MDLCRGNILGACFGKQSSLKIPRIFHSFPMLHKTEEVYCDEDEDDFDEGKEGQKGLGVSYTDCQ